MARLEDIRGLAEAHASSISSSPRDWMNYLDTAARLYRYPFMDQLLIHAQRPKATACASLELWNEKMLRWVNRGAKGIALLDETMQKTRLRYVFDIQDTHKVKGGRTPYLWRLQEKQQEELLNHLEEVYGLEAKDTGSLSDALMATAKYMVEENLDEYLDGLTYVTEGTYLEELEEDTIRSEFRSLLTDSIYYTLASRCGLDPLERQEEMDFVHITDYNSLSVLTFIGNATSMACESVLVDIGRFVHRISLEEMKKDIENSEERNYNKFNTLIRESKKNNNRIIENEYPQENEGGNEHGTDISSQRGLSVSESDNPGDRGTDREIRNAAEDISEGTQEQPVSEPVTDRETEQPSGRDRENSTEEIGSTDGEIVGEESSTVERREPDGVDSTYEQSDGNSGREHLDGIGIQLIEDTSEDQLSKAEEEIASALSLPELPSVNEQKREIENRIAALYAKEIAIPSEVVDEVLRTGGNRSKSQLRIIYNFMSEQTPEEYTEFVKREYGTGGKGFEINGMEYSVWFDETGLQIAVGHTVTDQILDKAFLSWEDVSGRIHQLLKQGEYAPQSVLDVARENAIKEHAQALAYMKADMAEGVAELVFDEEDLPHLHSIYPEITDYLEEKLTDPQWLADLNERLEGLAMAYEEDKSIMRFRTYNPIRISGQFQKFAAEVIPYNARDEFAWQEHKVFITQDEIDAFLAGGGPYSDGRLSTYSFYLLNEDDKARTDFIKEKYGIGGQSHALCGADNSHADYDGKVKIFRYVTENTFDSYMWQILENKQKFISQIMTSKSPVRACEDVDDTALSYAEIKALATGNEYIKEKMDLDVQVSKLKLLKANHTSQIYRLESDIAKRYPVQIAALKEKIAGMRVDADVVKGIDLQDNDHFAMTVGGKLYTDKKEAGVALLSAASGLKSVKSAGQIGEYHGFALSSEYNFLSNTYTMTIKGKCSYKIEFGKDTLGNIQRIHNALSAIGKKLADTEQNLETVQQQLKTAQEEVQKPFPKEAELSEKMERLAELNAMLNMDEKGGENLLADEGIGENPEVNMPEERQDRIADSVHKTSILERLKEQKQQEQTRETQQKPKKKHEQEL